MEKDKIAQDNHLFFYVTIGIALHGAATRHVTLLSLQQGTAQYGIESNGVSGYLRIDCTNVIDMCSHGSLAEMVREGILADVAWKIPSTEINGELNDEMEIDVNSKRGSFKFNFKITKYERDDEHGFEMTDDPLDLPDDEKLGRFVELNITVN